MSESIQNNKNTQVRVIDNIPVYNLQYAFISLWESVPPEKLSDTSRRLFKELCSSLEHDYGGDPGDQIRSETLIRLNIVDEKTARKSRNAPLVKMMNERLKQKKAANKKTDV